MLSRIEDERIVNLHETLEFTVMCVVRCQAETVPIDFLPVARTTGDSKRSCLVANKGDLDDVIRFSDK